MCSGIIFYFIKDDDNSAFELFGSVAIDYDTEISKCSVRINDQLSTTYVFSFENSTKCTVNESIRLLIKECVLFNHTYNFILISNDDHLAFIVDNPKCNLKIFVSFFFFIIN